MGFHLPESDQIPHQCLECDKLVRSRPINQCWICRDLEFEEEILCGLNRAVQTVANFNCHAFRPRLKMVSSNDAGLSASPPLIDPHSRQIAIQTIMASDKIKYQKALALQK
jgi:hypothetical protein